MRRPVFVQSDFGCFWGMFRRGAECIAVGMYFMYTDVNNVGKEGVMISEVEGYYVNLIEHLRELPSETEWLEYKCNNTNPQMIGEYISALSNSAALLDKENAYLVWGIDDTTHEVVGTDFTPMTVKKGNQELLNWLESLCSPRLNVHFAEIEVQGKKIVFLTIPSASSRPTAFAGEEFIRVGSYKRKLKDFPEKERLLWLSFETVPYEMRNAVENITEEEVTQLLDCAAYYTLMKLPLPSSRSGIIHNMEDEKFIRLMDNGRYAITNMGALLFAKDLSKFAHLKRKAIRVIKYDGNGRTKAIREEVFTLGYAVCFETVCKYIDMLIPRKEEIESGFRKESVMFPIKAIREMLGNLIIHQDLTVRGAGPMVELFDTKIESSNPGHLMVDVNRIIDTAPHTRNEAMASFLRIIRICEERGSGFDRMEEGMYDLKTPAPKVETGIDFARTKLYWYANLNEWTKEDKIRTCYLATCYCYVNEIPVSNAVLRERFGVEKRNKAIVSRIIKDTMESGFIKLADENAAPKLRRYIPYWA